LFQSFAKVIEKQIKVRAVQPVVPGPCMRLMDVFACIRGWTAEEHGNEHSLPCAEVRHIGSFKEVAEAIICQDFIVEAFRGSPDGTISPD